MPPRRTLRRAQRKPRKARRAISRRRTFPWWVINRFDRRARVHGMSRSYSFTGTCSLIVMAWQSCPDENLIGY